MTRPKKPKIPRRKASAGRRWASMRAAAAGIPLDIKEIKRAKDAGCPAFRGNQIYENELVEWLADNPPVIIPGLEDSQELLDRENTRLKNAKLRKEIEIQDGKYILRSDAESVAAKAVFAMKQELSSLARSLAPQLPGLEPIQIEARLEESHREALNRIAGIPWKAV